MNLPLSQLKFPPSTIIPPNACAWPSEYFEVECITIFAPNFNGLQWIGVATVLSTIKGTSNFFATFENLSKSNILSPGFPIVSPYISFVFSFAALITFSSLSPGSTNVTSIPIFFKLTLNRFTVPPYNVDAETIWSPALQIFNIAVNTAACPLEVATAPTPPSNKANFSSNAETVGLDILE